MTTQPAAEARQPHAPAPAAADPLLEFYRGRGTDDAGRTFDDVLACDDERLEHDAALVQWLFPLTEPSRGQPQSPVLHAATMAAFRADPTLRARLRAAFVRVLSFYGLELVDAGGLLRVREAASFPERAREWLRPGDHNFLRISRILRSLDLLGCPDYAAALSAGLEELYRREGERIGRKTLEIWRQGAGREAEQG